MTKDKNIWYAVDILVDADAAEAVEFALNELESLGTEIDSLRKAKGEPQMVTGFFDVLPESNDVQSAVENALRIHGLDPEVLKSITTRVVEETDWLAEWKKYWKPTEIGKLIIAPPWENVEGTDKIVIRIEPNMAFGTGTHETTQLCLKAIGENYRAGQTVLDVGTGTGILAIAAAKLGAETIFACDTDEDSVKIARENAVANEVDWIEFADGPLTGDAPVYDFVFANLTIDVIVPILPLLLAKSRQMLLLSGILVEQKDIISAELEKFQISNLKFETAGEWISVTIGKSS